MPTPNSPLLSTTTEELLAQIEHEAKCRRRQARALRRSLRRERRKEQTLHLRVVRATTSISSAGLAVIGAIAFVAAGVMFLLGEANEAQALMALASAAWSGAAGLAIFSRR
ncbi:hypothetical protein ACF09C_02670 [Streptomyces sp. NPDC014870]|uniref:hypothetical protein n=1 Tax=Streptomyces sp. NPDC014870 TaxID=3364925 RepID=UPI0036F7E68B